MFNGLMSNEWILPMSMLQPKQPTSVHRPLALKQSLNGGVLQSLSGIQCYSPFYGSPHSAFHQVTTALLCYAWFR